MLRFEARHLIHEVNFGANSPNSHPSCSLSISSCRFLAIPCSPIVAQLQFSGSPGDAKVFFRCPRRTPAVSCALSAFPKGIPLVEFLRLLIAN